jgi:hypothetical protein
MLAARRMSEGLDPGGGNMRRASSSPDRAASMS